MNAQFMSQSLGEHGDMDGRSADEVRDNLDRLMLEHIESVKKATFGGLSEDELLEQIDRLERIRDVSSHYILIMQNRDGNSGRKPMTEKTKVTLPAKVERIIPPLHPGGPEKAQIEVQDADPLYSEIRIENTLKDNDGKAVRLKEGTDVDVTVEAPKTHSGE